MRRMTGILLAAILILTTALPALAATNTYELPELKLSLEIPLSFQVFTRDAAAIDEELEKYGMIKAELREIMLASDIYLCAYSPETNDTIVVTMREHTLRDLNGLSDDALLSLTEQVDADYDLSITSSEIYRTDTLTFLRYYFNTTQDVSYSLGYYTVFDHRELNFIIHSKERRITASHEQLMEDLVNSLCLKTVASEPTEVPAVTEPKQTEAAVTKPEQGDDSGSFPGLLLGAGVSLGAAVLVVLTLLRRKSAASKRRSASVRDHADAIPTHWKMAIICPLCGSPTTLDSLFCYKCGTGLTKEAVRKPVETQAVPTVCHGDSTMTNRRIFCDDCGNRLLNGSNFCRRCGKKVSQ